MIDKNPFESIVGLLVLLTYISISISITHFTFQIDDQCPSEKEDLKVLAGFNSLFITLVLGFFVYFAWSISVGSDKTPPKLIKQRLNMGFWGILFLSVILTISCQFNGVDYINNCDTSNTDIQIIENMNRMQGLVWLFVIYGILGVLYGIGFFVSTKL